MIYSSLLFIYGFLPFSLIAYYLSPKKLQPAVLLGLSVLFCGLTGLKYLALVSSCTLFNYIAARLIEHFRSRKGASAALLAFGVFINILTLFVFRAEIFSSLREDIGFGSAFFPAGISFMILSAIGTLIDVYSGKISSERNFIIFGLYMLYFPKLIIGPLLRYKSFRKVLECRKPDLAEIGVGLTIFVKGLAKKVLAADTLFMMYEAVSSTSLRSMSMLTAWLGIMAYVLCLYFTLSGLSDMGTGVSYCFGLKLPQSFNYPLFSTKIRYFAARWHVQIVHWMRRFVTKPLFLKFRNNIVRRIVFIGVWGALGFWYTFSLNGIIWGFLMGSAITIESKIISEKVMNITGVIYTFFSMMICFAFFSGGSITDSLLYIGVLAGGGAAFADAFSLYLLKSYVVVLLITMYASTDLFRNMLLRSGKNRARTAVTAVTPVMILVLLIVCTAMISYSGSSEMILIKL